MEGHLIKIFNADKSKYNCGAGKCLARPFVLLTPTQPTFEHSQKEINWMAKFLSFYTAIEAIILCHAFYHVFLVLLVDLFPLRKVKFPCTQKNGDETRRKHLLKRFWCSWHIFTHKDKSVELSIHIILTLMMYPISDKIIVAVMSDYINSRVQTMNTNTARV